MQVQAIDYESVDSVVDTLHEAFYDYPVMRYVLGPDAQDFTEQHARLIRLFVMGRVFCKEPLLGVGKLPMLAATAIVSLPETTRVPDELTEYRQQVWGTFPPDAKARYDAFVDACGQFDIDVPHHHLNMVGVRKSHMGTGLGKRLVEYVVAMADLHPQSRGVSLSTESAANVPFYKNLGFEITGHADVGPGLETWNFFREQQAQI